jgi:hypothetical protein
MLTRRTFLLAAGLGWPGLSRSAQLGTADGLCPVPGRRPEERFMTHSAVTIPPAASLPPIDVAVPARLETATFALG